MVRTATPLRQRLREAATEAMLDSAERAMIEYGYEHATMQQIAAEAGCATGTFYIYFKNKEELFLAIVARHSTAMFQAACEALGAAGEPLEKIRAATAAIVRYAFQHKPFFRLFFTAMPWRHRAMREKLGSRTRAEQDQYSRLELDLLRQAQQQGSIRGDMPAELLQEFMVNGGFSIMERLVFSSEKRSAEEHMRLLWGLISGGIGVRSGGHANA